MNWSDENYCKLYTRDSFTWKAWPWQARALWPLILRKLDGAGMVEVGSDPVHGIALQVECPIEFVTVGLRAIIDSGTLVQVPGALLSPTFIEAQESRKTPQQSKKEHREQERDRRRWAQVFEIRGVGGLPSSSSSSSSSTSFKSTVDDVKTTTIDGTFEDRPQLSLIPPPNRINAPPETLEDRLQKAADKFTDDEYTVLNHWRQVMNSPTSRPSPARKKLIAKALKWFTLEQVLDAIEGCAASKWHMGENDRGTRYNALELILRNEQKIEEFISRRKGTTNAANTRR